MQVADETDVMLSRNGPDALKSHTFVDSDTMRSTARHLTDDATTLSSRPETRRSSRLMNNLPGRLEIGYNILLKIWKF